MNRLLLKECLDELRSDDSVELTEAEESINAQAEKERFASGQRLALVPDSRKGALGVSRNESPAQADSTAGQRTRAVGHEFTPEELQKASDFLERLAQLFGAKMDSEHHSLYFKNQIDGSTLTFRLANHSGNAYQFLRRGEITGNFGVVIKMENGKFKKNKRVDYTEEVFFPSELTPEKEDAIANGVSNWIATGEYNGPRGDRTKQSVRTEQTPAPQNQQVSQQAAPPTGPGVQAPPPAPPATPPTGPGVQESFFSRFSNLDYLYRILDEGKDSLIDRLPSLDDAQKTHMKQFFAKRPSLESKFDWNKPDTITWDSFQNIANGYEEPIDPDTVPELSDKRDEGDGIVSYEVQDDKDGQLAVRRIVDTHWGKHANPWCLIARNNGELDDEAWDYWLDYSLLHKRIAFKNGKLLAFMATDGDNGWSPSMLPENLRGIYKREFEAWYRSLSPEQLEKLDTEYGWSMFNWIQMFHPDEYRDSWKNYPEEWWDRFDKKHPSVHDCVMTTPPQEPQGA